MTRPSSRLLAALAVVGAAIAASLVGGVGTGHAATSFSVTNRALIGTTANEVPQVIGAVIQACAFGACARLVALRARREGSPEGVFASGRVLLD